MGDGPTATGARGPVGRAAGRAGPPGAAGGAAAARRAAEGGPGAQGGAGGGGGLRGAPGGGRGRRRPPSRQGEARLRAVGGADGGHQHLQGHWSTACIVSTEMQRGRNTAWLMLANPRGFTGYSGAFHLSLGRFHFPALCPLFKMPLHSGSAAEQKPILAKWKSKF